MCNYDDRKLWKRESPEMALGDLHTNTLNTTLGRVVGVEKAVSGRM